MEPKNLILDAVYRQLMEAGLRYFLPGAHIQMSDCGPPSGPNIEWGESEPDELVLGWLGCMYRMRRPCSKLVQQGPGAEDDAPQSRGFTAEERRFIAGIGRVLSIRYRIATHAVLAARSAHLYRGLPEDRYVSAYLDPSGYRDPEAVADSPDRISDAIEVFRLSAMTTYENRRISTGAILFGSQPDNCHLLPASPEGALRYASDLTSTRSFHRLADGLKTLAVVDRNGLLVELVDIDEWAAPFSNMDLPAPVARRYEPHCRATLCGGHICMILTTNGEIKAFSNGAQVLTFRDGRWRLGSTAECFATFSQVLGNDEIAHRLFEVALNMVESRRGGLFVCLRDASMLHRLVADEDALASDGDTGEQARTKRRFHYLLRSQNMLSLPRSVLETVARIDGAIVIDSEGNLLTFGAILQNSIARAAAATEGSRTVAALSASYFGPALKVSEDGIVSLYVEGRLLWEI